MAKDNVQENKGVEIPEEKILEIAEIEQNVEEEKSFGQKVKEVFSKDNLKKGVKAVGLMAVGGVIGIAALLIGTKADEDDEDPIDVDYVELDEIQTDTDSDENEDTEF